MSRQPKAIVSKPKHSILKAKKARERAIARRMDKIVREENRRFKLPLILMIDGKIVLEKP